MHRTRLGAVFHLVVEHQAQWPARLQRGKTMRRAGRDNEQIAGTGVTLATIDDLQAFAGQKEDKLRIIVLMRADFRVTVAVELEFAQHKTEGVNLDLLDEDWTPGGHVGNMLSKVGNVLTQAPAAR